jgi:hypothetical protein
MRRAVRLLLLGAAVAFAGFVASMLYVGWSSYRQLPEGMAPPD